MRVTDSNGMTGYDRLGSGQVCLTGKNDQWADHPAMTAVGLLCRIFIDKKRGDPALAQGSKILMADLPKWDASKERPTIDSYYWYYATLALFQLDGPKGPSWTRSARPSTRLSSSTRSSARRPVAPRARGIPRVIGGPAPEAASRRRRSTS